MKTSVTIQNLDAATANWLFAEAQRLNQSVEVLILEIIHKEIHLGQKAAQHPARSLQVANQYAEAYGQFPIRADEFDLDESQLQWEFGFDLLD